MTTLCLILLLQLSTQYQLYTVTGQKAGVISSNKNIVFIQLKYEKVEQFKLIFKQKRSNGIVIYYIENERANGYIWVTELAIYLSFATDAGHRIYEGKFLRYKR